MYVIPAIYLPAVSDVALFETVGVKVLERTDFYAFDRPNHATFPFLPLFVWIYAIFHYLSVATGIPFVVFVRLLVILCIFGIVRLLPKETRLLFLFNPVVFIVSAHHGQADMAVALFAMLSVVAGAGKKTGHLMSGIYMSISVFVKNWSVILIPLFLLRLKSLSWSLGFLAASFFMLGFYIRVMHANPKYIYESFVSHSGGAPGYFGVTGVLRLLSFVQPEFGKWILYVFDKSVYILIVAFTITYLFIIFKKFDIKKSILLLVLSFLIVTPGWGLQYASWVLPFAAFLGHSQVNKIRMYSLLAFTYLSVSYLSFFYYDFNFSTITILLGIPVWIFAIWWFLGLLFTRGKSD